MVQYTVRYMVDPPGHRPEPATWRRVTSAVAELLRRHGLRAAKLGAVAATAGVDESWLRESFADVGELVAEVVRGQIHEVFAVPGHRLTTAAGLDDLCRWRDDVVAAYRATRVPAGYPLGIIAHEATGLDDRVGRALAAHLAPWQSALGDAFSRLRDRGALAPCVPPAELATAVMGALVGAMARSRDAGLPDEVLAPFAMMLRHVMSVFAGPVG